MLRGSLPALSSRVKKSKKKTGNRWKSFYVGDDVGCDWFPRRVEKTGCWTVNLPPKRGVKWGGTLKIEISVFYL